MFSDVLITVDFDRTLTGPDSKIPQRNLDAITYFMENGGTFTVNTGRSPATFWKYLDTVPVNAPFLLFNGSAAYHKGELSQLHPIDLDVWQTMEEMANRFPDMNLEIQGTKAHYLINPSQDIVSLYENLQWRYAPAQWGQNVGTFLKFAFFGKVHKPVVGDMFTGTPEEIAAFDNLEATIRELYPDKVEVFRAAPRIVDVHAKGVSKLNAARQLQKQLNKKILICIGDAENDLSMLEGADYAFCPSDSIVADRFPNVCSCGEGAVADVIYKELPKILKIQP